MEETNKNSLPCLFIGEVEVRIVASSERLPIRHEFFTPSHLRKKDATSGPCLAVGVFFAGMNGFTTAILELKLLHGLLRAL